MKASRENSCCKQIRNGYGAASHFEAAPAFMIGFKEKRINICNVNGKFIINLYLFYYFLMPPDYNLKKLWRAAA